MGYVSWLVTRSVNTTQGIVLKGTGELVREIDYRVTIKYQLSLTYGRIYAMEVLLILCSTDLISEVPSQKITRAEDQNQAVRAIYARLRQSLLAGSVLVRF